MNEDLGSRQASHGNEEAGPRPSAPTAACCQQVRSPLPASASFSVTSSGERVFSGGLTLLLPTQFYPSEQNLNSWLCTPQTHNPHSLKTLELTWNQAETGLVPGETPEFCSRQCADFWGLSSRAKEQLSKQPSWLAPAHFEIVNYLSQRHIVLWLTKIKPSVKQGRITIFTSGYLLF